jgi:hypothetical protein
MRLGLAIAVLAAGCTALVNPDRSRLDQDPPCRSDEECDDGDFCNGAEICVASKCVEEGNEPCDDGVPCTLDFCDSETHDCSNETRDERCSQDPVVQRCDAIDGCVPIPAG